MRRRNSRRSAAAASAAEHWYAPSDLAEDEPAIWSFGRPVVVLRDVKNLFDQRSLLLMQDALSLNPSAEIIDELHESVTRAAAHYFFVRNACRCSRISELRKEISELHETLELSLYSIYNLSTSAWLYMLMSLRDAVRAVHSGDLLPEHGNALFREWYVKADEENLSVVRNKNIDHLLQWTMAAEYAKIYLEHTEDKGGRHKDLALYNYINRLAEVFHEFTGRDAGLTQDPDTAQYSGSFFDFIVVNLCAVDPERKFTNAGLGKAAQRALASERKLRRRKSAQRKRR